MRKRHMLATGLIILAIATVLAVLDEFILIPDVITNPFLLSLITKVCYAAMGVLIYKRVK